MKWLKYYVRVWLVLMPMGLLPVTGDQIWWSKHWLMVAGAMGGWIWWGIETLVSKEKKVKWRGSLTGGLILLAWAMVGWWKLPLGARVSSWMSPMGIGTLAAAWSWLFLLTQTQSDKKEREKQVWWLSIGGLITVVTGIGIFLLPSSKLPIVWPKNNVLINIGEGWSLWGSLWAELGVMVMLAMEWERRWEKRMKQGKGNYFGAAAMMMVFGLMAALAVYRLAKMGWPKLDGMSSWTIAVETLKRSPWWGVGAGNMTEAFYAYRPVGINMTKNWATVFKQSGMGWTHWWTELGLGALAGGWLLLAGWLKARKDKGKWLGAGVTLAIVMLLPPETMIVWAAVWILTGLAGENETVEGGWKLKAGEREIEVWPIVIIVIAVAGLAVAGWGGYWWGRNLLGEMAVRRAMLAAEKNDGARTYEEEQRAIAMNPLMGEYRRMFSQANLALGQAILSNNEASGEERQKAGIFIQQAVGEGKAAIGLSNKNPAYWQNLAAIYRGIIGMVDGAPDWSYQAYVQAAALDPVNPILKVELGGLLYAAGKYEDADRIFEQAVVAKGDFANAWYNWAYTAKNLGKIEAAVQRLEQAVALVPVSSGDHDKASGELTTWKKELEELLKKQQGAAAAAPEPETLKTPQPLPTVGEEEKVNLPAEELSPPKEASESASP